MRKRTGARSRPRSASAFVLDVFTERDLDDWSTRSIVAQRYLDHVYFDLELQRVEHFEELRDALSAVPPITVDVTSWIRISDYRWSLEPLSPAGSLKGIGGRFNIGVDLDRARGQHFPALYLADSMDTALREFFLGSPEDETTSLSLQQLAIRRELAHRVVAVVGRVDEIILVDGQGVDALCEDVFTERADERSIRLVDDAAGIATGQHEDAIP